MTDVHDTVRSRREDYAKGELVEDNAAEDPFEEFEAWMQLATESDDVDEPNAMTIATVSADGAPAARVVLLRGFDSRGFEFYTNYESAKGRDLEQNPRISAVFFWPALQKQVRVDGAVVRVDRDESDDYFASRPYKSKLGAHVSQQSAVIPSRATLEDDLAALQQTYPEDATIPRPAHWGGYRVEPTSMEFWQGRRSRLHDRLRYRREGTVWVRERLAP